MIGLLNIDELEDLYRSRIFRLVSYSRRLTRAGKLTWMADERNAKRILLRNVIGKYPLLRLRDRRKYHEVESKICRL